MFKALGVLVTLIGVAVVVGMALVVLQNIPDIERYLRIRSM